MRWNCKRPIFNFLVPPAKDLVEQAWGLIARQSSNQAEQPGATENAQALKTDLVPLLISWASYSTSLWLDFFTFKIKRLSSTCSVPV